MRHKKLVLLVVFVALLIAVGNIQAQNAVQDTALAFVEDNYGVSAADLKVDYRLEMEVPGLGNVTQFKILHQSSGETYGAYVDEAGQTWTPEAYREAADLAYQALYGKLDIPLFVRYEENPDNPVLVDIWLIVDDAMLSGLRAPDFVGPGLGLNAEPAHEGDMVEDGGPSAVPFEYIPESNVVAAAESLNKHVANLQAAVIGRLAARGVQAQGVENAPILSAWLTRAQTLWVSEDPAVGRIYAADVESQDMNASAGATHRAPGVWVRGYTGSGAKVAVLEDSRAYQNFWLYNYVDAKDWTDPNMDDHVTQLMGNIGSSHGYHLGMSRGASLYSANATDYSTANLQSAATWAVGQGVHVINNSWGVSSPTGCLSSMGRFFDYRVVVDRVLTTFAAGNSGEWISDHAMAFNVLTVGAFNDVNNGEWNDDRMSSFSAWREGVGCSPSNGDREKPDVVAVGERILSTRIHPPSIDWVEQSSTSFATAMVSGEAALLLEVNPDLAGKPEAMRALIMASAWNNIEGNQSRSEYDGAGGIDAYSAYLTALNGRYAQLTITPNTWTSYDFNFYAGADEPISCAAAWTSHPNASYTSDPLLTDIDLRIYRPTGELVASSTSSNNSFEIARVVTDEAGTWKCRISKYSSSGSTWEYVGIAVDRNFQVNYDYPFEKHITFSPLIIR